MPETVELTDRLERCIVKGNCSGPSYRSPRQRQDMWTCEKCQGWTLVKKGEEPQLDSARGGR